MKATDQTQPDESPFQRGDTYESENATDGKLLSIQPNPIPLTPLWRRAGWRAISSDNTDYIAYELGLCDFEA